MPHVCVCLCVCVFHTAGLEAEGIPYLHPTAAMFCWVDLRAGLLSEGWEGERELWQALVDIGVLITPGRCRHHLHTHA